MGKWEILTSRIEQIIENLQETIHSILELFKGI